MFIVVAPGRLVRLEQVGVSPFGVLEIARGGVLYGLCALCKFCLDPTQLRECQHHLVLQGHAVYALRGLRNVSNGDAPPAAHRAAVRTQPAYQRFEQGRFALSVWSDDSNASSFVDVNRDALEYLQLGEADGKIGCGYELHGASTSM